MTPRLLKSSLACVVGALAVAGCGSSSSSSTPSTTPAPAATAPTSTTSAPAASAKTAGGGSTVTLQANPSGTLMFVETSLKASAGKVTINFENPSVVPHNVTVKNSAGKILGDTPTFTQGSKSVTLDLAKGTYTYYCSVPGHEQAGMKGTLTVS